MYALVFLGFFVIVHVNLDFTYLPKHFGAFIILFPVKASVGNQCLLAYNTANRKVKILSKINHSRITTVEKDMLPTGEIRPVIAGIQYDESISPRP